MHALWCIPIWVLRWIVWRQLSYAFLAYSLAVRIFYIKEMSKLKKVMSMVLSIVMLITMLSVGFSGFADTAPTSFYIYSALDEYEDEETPPTPVDAAYWEKQYHIYNHFDSESGTLYVFGNTAIPDFYLSPDTRWSDICPERWMEHYDLNEEHIRLMGELVKKIVICDGITAVGKGAFSKVFKNVETVCVPGSVKSIDYEAFSNIKKKKNLVLCEGIEKICYGAFCCDNALKEVTLPASINSLTASDYKGYYFGDPGEPDVALFESCASLRKIVDLSKTENGCYANYCPALTTLVINSPLDRAYWYYDNCPNMKDFYILNKQSGDDGMINDIESVYYSKETDDEYYNMLHEDEPGFKPQSEFYYRIAPLYKKVTVHCYRDSDAYQLAKACEAKKVRILDAPAKVSGLKAKKVTTNSVTLTWKGTSRASYYEVQRYLNRYKAWKTVATVKGKTTCKVGNLTSLSTFKFRVRAVNKSAYTLECGTFSDVTKATTKIGSVTIYNPSVSGGKISFRYSKSHNCTDYEIYIKSGKNGKYKKLATTKKQSYTSKRMKKGTYYIKVRARKKVSKGKYNYSAYSKEIKIKI